jgi:hypothetical protein
LIEPDKPPIGKTAYKKRVSAQNAFGGLIILSFLRENSQIEE